MNLTATERRFVENLTTEPEIAQLRASTTPGRYLDLLNLRSGGKLLFRKQVGKADK